MTQKEIIGIYAKGAKSQLEGAKADDIAAIINALSGLVMYPRAADVNVMSDDMAVEEGSRAAEVLAAHTDEDGENKIRDTYFARGYHGGAYHVMNVDEAVTAKTLLQRLRHAVIYTTPAVDIDQRTITFADNTKFTDVGYWGKDHFFAKDRRNPHNNHKIERMEEFFAKFTFDEMKALLLGYFDILPSFYPSDNFE